ncbi:Uncharacterised protein [Enterobacter kobei]|nr:Uncharacterised protein [Enterobacter kobei]
MTFTIPCQLDRVFGGFQQGDRIGLPDDLPLGFNGEAQGYRCGIGIDHHSFTFRNFSAAFDKGVLWRSGERVTHGFGQGAELNVVNKPLHVTVATQQGKRERYRAGGDI